MSPLLVLIVAVLATTYAGPIVRFAAAPALAIAFWRLALVLPVTGGLAVLERSGKQGAGSSVTRAILLPAPRSLLPLMTLSGLLLALHFWSWIASLRFTTVASSVLLVSLKPVFAWGIAAAWLREHPTRAEAWGIALAVIGASLIGLGDARLSSGALGGDVLALLALARSMPLVGFAGRDWTVFGAMAAGPMLVGHTGMNYALRHFRATTVNVAALGEPVGASVIAWLVPSIHEVPPPTAVLGGVLVLLGIGLSLGAGSRDGSGHAR